MENEQTQMLTVSVNINQSLDVVWDTWNDENQMANWMFISDEYEVMNPKNDLTIGGGYSYSMVSKDGGFNFEYSGTYTHIDFMKYITFELKDGRGVEVVFSVIEDYVNIEMRFEAVAEQDTDVQVIGWQALLVNFKNLVEKIA